MLSKELMGMVCAQKKWMGSFCIGEVQDPCCIVCTIFNQAESVKVLI